MMAYTAGGSDHKEIKSENELPLETQSGWSEEHDCVPLKQRLKMLLAKGESKSHDKNFIPPIDIVIKTEDDHCDSLGFYSDHYKSEARSRRSSSEHIQDDMVHAIESSPLQEGMLSQRQEVEHTDVKNNPANQMGSFQDVSFSAYVQGVEANIVVPADIFDDLDHIVLKERQRMLLSRKLVGSIKPAMEHNISNSSTTVDKMILQNAGIEKRGSDLYGNRSGIKGNVICENRDENVYEFCQHQGTTFTESGNDNDVCREARAFSSSRSDINEKCKTKIVPTSVLPSFANVKVELLGNELENPNKGAIGHPYLNKIVPVKSELVNSAEILEDIIDHMFLGERIKLLAAREFPKTILHENFGNSKKFVPSGLDCRPSSLESSESLKVKRPRKRRKTITDSVETALEEDAPGLLHVLIERGILVDEIKLYGETEVDEASDESSIEESFSELEDVISKIFSQRPSLLKLAPIRCSKGEKASYCLACLISLVEQARYLQFRKWPVEWGWCRDLQSFIFVFERHNRIVLERPEYGYATYFFELVDTTPVSWQIKRLVTAMKLTSCSRITLIENRALMVGDDLTEGEARVLMEYGWVPDSGLGTMLNYRDRVVHDRRHETSDTSEWRSKIGKLLMDGYNGGTIVPNEIPNNLMEYSFVDTPHVKLEQ